MTGTDLAAFIQRIKSDPALRQTIVDAEKVTAQGMSLLKDIAAQEGFDLSSIQRPSAGTAPSSSEVEGGGDCPLTCCIVETSTTVITEPPFVR